MGFNSAFKELNISRWPTLFLAGRNSSLHYKQSYLPKWLCIRYY